MAENGTVFAHVSVNISVGSDAVQTADDVADLLRQAADRLNRKTLEEVDNMSLTIRDVNGNRVGNVQVTGYTEVENG